MKAFTNRIEIAGKGSGEFSEEEIQKRAREIAISDGRHSASEKDILQAREELTRPAVPEQSPETSPSTNELKEWDTPVDATGSKHEKQEQEDEIPAGEKLTAEGLEEADHDTRVNSAKRSL